MLDYQFFQYALIAILTVAVASAMIGTYIVSRRLVALSGGVTHACFGGLGLGYWLGVSPVAMAGVFAVGAALAVEWMGRRGRIREDSAIAVVWALGMAAGVLFVFLTPGYVPELNSFLFGNILSVTQGDIIQYLVFLAVLAVFFALQFRRIVACAFDSDFARVSGLPATAVNCVMTIFTALCIVLTIRMVGIMLLMSMLAMPQLIAELFTRRFASMMFGAMAVSAFCSVVGLTLSALIDVPASALIVIAMVAVYLPALAIRRLLFR